MIVACDLPSLGSVRSAPACAFASDADAELADELARLTDLVAPTLREGGTVLAVVPAWADEPLVGRLLMVRSALDSSRLVIHRTPLPPLAAGTLVQRAAALAEAGVDAGELVAALPLLEDATVAAAWLGSVARLRHPAPTLRQHARSYWRRPAFGAIIDDAPRVETLRGGEARLPLPAVDVPDRYEVLIGIGQGDVTLVERSVAASLPGADVSRVSLHDASRRWWGTDKVIELAIHPAADPTSAVTVGELARCGWCGERVARARCPFCGEAQVEAEHTSVARDDS